MYTKPILITVSDWIRVPQGLPPMLYRKVQERLVFVNPEYEMRHLRGEWIGGIQPQINCIRKSGRFFLFPRGFLDQFLELCQKMNVAYKLQDRRRQQEPVAIEFHGQLKEYQQQAAESVLERDFATLLGGHKSGKTVIGLYTIAMRRQPVLILIPRLDLLQGWLTKIANFLQIPREEVGIFADGRHIIGDRITIAHSGEMMRHWKKIRNRIGYLIVDECQRCPSKVFTHLVTNFDTRYMLGLTNTTQRRDRLSRLMYYYIGDTVYAINEKDAKEGRGIIRADVVARTTPFEYPYQSRDDLQAMLRALMADSQRTRLIADDVQRELDKGAGPLLIVSGGEVQNEALRRELARRDIPVAVVPGPRANGNGRASRSDDDADSFRSGSSVLLVSPQVLMESGSPVASRTLFLAIPLYFKKGLARAIQNFCEGPQDDGKRVKIYDYVDLKIGLLENYFRMRSYNYGVHPEMLLNAN